MRDSVQAHVPPVRKLGHGVVEPAGGDLDDHRDGGDPHDYAGPARDRVLVSDSTGLSTGEWRFPSNSPSKRVQEAELERNGSTTKTDILPRTCRFTHVQLPWWHEM
jgi:hypothetical protein